MRNKGVWAIVLLIALIIILSIVKVNITVEEKVTEQVPYLVQETVHYTEIVNETKPFGVRECEEKPFQYETRFNQSYEIVNSSIYNYCRLYVKNLEQKPANFTFYAKVEYEHVRTYEYGDMTKEIKANSEEEYIWSQKVDVKEPISCSFRISEAPKLMKCEYPPNQYATVEKVVQKNRTVNTTEYKEVTGLKNVTKYVPLILVLFE